MVRSKKPHALLFANLFASEVPKGFRYLAMNPWYFPCISNAVRKSPHELVEFGSPHSNMFVHSVAQIVGTRHYLHDHRERGLAWMVLVMRASGHGKLSLMRSLAAVVRSSLVP